MKLPEIKIKHVLAVVAVIAVVIAIIFWRMGVNHAQEVDALNTRLWEANQDIRNYEIMVDNLAEHASETELLLVDKDSEIFQLTEEKERLRALNIKRVNAIARLEARISVLEDSIKPTGPNVPAKPPWTVFVPTVEDEGGPALPLPASFEFKDEWMRLYADINTQGMGTLGMDMKDIDLNIVLGEKKVGLFKREPVAITTTSNPYVGIAEQNVALVDETTKSWKPFAIGAGTGVGVVLLIHFLLGQ
jgi:hypothetical protein